MILSRMGCGSAAADVSRTGTGTRAASGPVTGQRWLGPGLCSRPGFAWSQLAAQRVRVFGGGAGGGCRTRPKPGCGRPCTWWCWRATRGREAGPGPSVDYSHVRALKGEATPALPWLSGAALSSGKARLTLGGIPPGNRALVVAGPLVRLLRRLAVVVLLGRDRRPAGWRGVSVVQPCESAPVTPWRGLADVSAGVERRRPTA